MKKNIITIILALASVLIASAQSTNPLNYSGRMYVEAIEIIATPRYVSYEDHAILSKELRIPALETMKCEMDFEKGTILVDDKTIKVKVTSTKKYEEDFGCVVVVYMDIIGKKNKMELVWSQFGAPFLQQITPTDSGVDIARMILSDRP